MTDTQRPPPVLRKEVVPTSQWGELIVRQLLASDRVALSMNDAEGPQDETDAQRRQRISRNYALFLAELMACAVVGKDGEPMYSAADWDAWNSTQGEDCLALANKALAINGYRTLGGEDVAKND